MRIVSDCSRHQQDQIASQLMQLFTELGQPLPKLVDRRTHPSHGYRAVHVIVYVDGAPIEIQVRTKLQHEWANLFEKLADRVGRGIRYGEPPEHFRDRMVGFRDPEMVYTELYKLFEFIVRIAHNLADQIDSHERYAPTATGDALVALEESITSMFAGVRSMIELMPRTRRGNL